MIAVRYTITVQATELRPPRYSPYMACFESAYGVLSAGSTAGSPDALPVRAPRTPIRHLVPPQCTVPVHLPPVLCSHLHTLVCAHLHTHVNVLTPPYSHHCLRSIATSPTFLTRACERETAKGHYSPRSRWPSVSHTPPTHTPSRGKIQPVRVWRISQGVVWVYHCQNGSLYLRNVSFRLRTVSLYLSVLD